MSTPAFRKGPPPTPDKPASDGTWVAKYDGTCTLCLSRVHAGVTQVKWNDEGIAIICAHHRVRT